MLSKIGNDMAKFVEIDSDLFDDAASEIRTAYYSDGGFIVRKLLPSSFLTLVADQIISVIDLIDEKIKSDLNINLQDCRINVASKMLIELEKRNSASQSIVYDVMDHTPIMHNIASSKYLMRVLEPVLSKHILIHQRLILLMSMPSSSWHLARWHQDYYYNGDPESTCTVYAPLQFTNKDNGGLILAKSALTSGPQHHSANNYEEHTKWNTLSHELVDKYTDLVQIELMPGDVLFFHSLTPHTAQINTTQDVRFVMNFRYRDMLDKKFTSNNWKTNNIPLARAALARMSPIDLRDKK
jgi:hypothetical protein